MVQGKGFAPPPPNSPPPNSTRAIFKASTASKATLPSMPPSGLLSYIPTSLSSILPVRGCDAAPSPSPSPSPSPPPPASPAPSKMSPSVKAADRAELARVFELFDRNGDGRITREELEDSLGKLGIPVPGDELAAMIARIDADGDGCVDVEEFGELYRAIMSTGGGGGKKGSSDEEAEAEEAEDEDEDMREAFRVFDANGDGFITVDELSAVLASLGLKQGRSAEECRRMIGQVDRDGDGRVDFHEFRQMMRGGGLAALA